MKKIPILGELTSGTTQRHMIKLPGAALANDEPRPVITLTGAKPGSVLFVNAGVHGGPAGGMGARGGAGAGVGAHGGAAGTGGAGEHH